MGRAETTNGKAAAGDDVDRAALAGMLSGYGQEQLVDEVITAWEELASANKELANSNQRNRVMELDLSEREELGAPDRARLMKADEDLRDREARIIHLERMLDDTRREKEAIANSVGAIRIDELERNENDLSEKVESQANIIGELEAKLDQLVEALEKAAEAGLTSITADEVRNLNHELEDAHRKIEAEQIENNTVSEERDKLREMVTQTKSLLEQRDLRLKELDGQMQRMMDGPRSISAEHDYLVEQIEELKRRLLERNREYEALRRRERRLHRDVFERDERIQQMQLTISDIEGGLSDRTAELKTLEEVHDRMAAEVDGLRKSEKTRGVVSGAFQDSLGVLRSHEQTKARREGLGIEVDDSIPEPGEGNAPGGSASPALKDIDDLE
jgi:chromosome segregation ATPase